jgi:hypothetical protein
MPHEITKIADIVEPVYFAKYVISRTKELSAFFQSGIIGDVKTGGIPNNLTSGGTTINMPFWFDLHNTDEILSDSAALTVNKITAGKDVAVLHFRGSAWGVNDLAAQLSGADPSRAIGDLMAAWWDRQMQLTLLHTLTGAFSAASSATNVLDISDASDDAANINGKTFIDATQRLGDAKDQLVAIGMHSATQAALAKQDLIQTQRNSEGRVLFETFMGKRIIVDDGMPVETVTPTGDNPPPPYKVYTSYLFGAGAIGYEEGGVLNPTETDRDILKGDNYITTRRAFILHPRGIKWQGAAAGASPTNTELATGTNWARVYESKAIRIVQFKHRIAI